MIYIGSSGSQFVVALEAQTGKPRGIRMTSTFNWGTPLVLGNTLYFAATVATEPRDKGGLVALEVSKGSILKELWRVPAPETVDPGQQWSGIASSPVSGGGRIFFGALDGKLYAVAP